MGKSSGKMKRTWWVCREKYHRMFFELNVYKCKKIIQKNTVIKIVNLF